MMNLFRRSTITYCIQTAALAGILAIACKPSAEKPKTAAVPTPTARQQVPAAPELPPLGQARVELSERGVTVLANEAPRLDVLNELARVAGFKLVVGELSEGHAGNASVYTVDSPLGEALIRVLSGIPFRLDFDVDSERGGSVLREVTVGKVLGQRIARGKSQGDRTQRAEQRVARRKQLANTLSDEERLKRIQERAAWGSKELDNPDPNVRAEAAGAVDIHDSKEFQRLASLLKSDSSPEVRAAAAERIGDSDAASARDLLRDALNDTNAQVVKNAIEQLEFGGDDSLIPDLEPLLQHPDPEVREQAQDAIDFLE